VVLTLCPPAVTAQVEIVRKLLKRFIEFELRALNPSADNQGSTCPALPSAR
jgi:hypothetical protein